MWIKVGSTVSARVKEETAQPVAREDHRVRVGRERRERMRAHLLKSLLHVCSDEGTPGGVLIDDIIRHAEVSRGTFYKYFDSVDQAVGELGLSLADEMTAGMMSVYDPIAEPVLRTATGFQLFLIRAMLDYDWGAFIAQIGLLSADHLFTAKIKSDIELGIQAGDYNVPSVDVASDLLMGAKAQAIRRLIKGAGLPYAQAMSRAVLVGFGVSPDKAEVSVLKAFDRLIAEAPGRLSWWRDPRAIDDRAFPESPRHRQAGRTLQARGRVGCPGDPQARDRR